MTEGNDLVNLTVDGIGIAVEPGTHVIDAAERAGVQVHVPCVRSRFP